MTFFPSREETLVYPFSAERAEALLFNCTKDPELEKEEIEVVGKEYLFNGIVKDGKYRVSVIIKHPQNFIPFIEGEIVKTNLGCIIHCKYRLFFSTRVLLGFWSGLTLGLGILYLFIHPQITHAIFAFVIGIGNYIIAYSNFKMHQKRSRRVLLSVFKEEDDLNIA
ncbi:MAG: hypothetical protein RIC80_20115 [Cyclobacteriaceae bacterium]